MRAAADGFSADALAEWSEEDRAALHEAVDESDYSFADWIEALAAFDRWLSDQGEKRRPWRGMIGYIHCCTLMTTAPGIALANLKVIVNQSLIEFGFQLLDESQA